MPPASYRACVHVCVFSCVLVLSFAKSMFVATLSLLFAHPTNTIHTNTACLLSHETCDVTTLTAAAAIEVDVMMRAHLRPFTCAHVSADVVM